ncbi:hypothetical protein CHS0354_042863 [Potamilus streckersoni]|uniref:Uncharacterized protein n=1 Tax=Potamilus streckersoni TaxID=2493646 RepID=A0AAE0W887_9BIVA|nr:hypothetical protein CHS0354_042863 [Potamilus streckersoni]
MDEDMRRLQELADTSMRRELYDTSRSDTVGGAHTPIDGLCVCCGGGEIRLTQVVDRWLVEGDRLWFYEKFMTQIERHWWGDTEVDDSWSS